MTAKKAGGKNAQVLMNTFSNRESLGWHHLLLSSDQNSDWGKQYVWGTENEKYWSKEDVEEDKEQCHKVLYRSQERFN